MPGVSRRQTLFSSGCGIVMGITLPYRVWRDSSAPGVTVEPERPETRARDSERRMTTLSRFLCASGGVG